ncbi:hypothetical protein C5E45_04690 [Nocardia nova]|uniref:Uncharacterized protein n=1 Tax=Nocardia nova TaxID=37330 RepID=A0A2S6AW20_9NOCA|nr:hypothetical protein [Nocardia nova]PPJ33642.1 hypothetical protein C5E41_03615 [Nocardia nova]PPJ39436.1 hypothetical protein C5E45_04690 [Nocardia nova]
MTDHDANVPAAQSDPPVDRIRELAARAEAAGYVLVGSAAPRYEWKLLDSEYREDIFSTTELDRIEQWLDS